MDNVAKLIEEAIMGEAQMELRLHRYQGNLSVGWRLWPEGFFDNADWSHRPEAGPELEAQLSAVIEEAKKKRTAGRGL